MYGLFSTPYGSNTKFAINKVNQEFHLVTDPLDSTTNLPIPPLTTPFFHHDTEQSYDIKSEQSTHSVRHLIKFLQLQL